jgi:predicted transcriptional regulator of viral defense system
VSPSSASELLSILPGTFTYREGIAAGLSEHHVRRLVCEGRLERQGRGIYHQSDAPSMDEELCLVAAAAPDATLCLLTALARHGLTDRIPIRFDVALPRSRRSPKLPIPVLWHRFADDTFSLGRKKVALDGGRQIGLYSAERTLVDVFRIRHLEGVDLAHGSLKRWLRAEDSQPADLLAMARRFPMAERVIRQALELLL